MAVPRRGDDAHARRELPRREEVEQAREELPLREVPGRAEDDQRQALVARLELRRERHDATDTPWEKRDASDAPSRALPARGALAMKTRRC